MHLFLSLLFPLYPILVSASEPNTSLTLLNRRDACSLVAIITENSGLHTCGTPGWGVVFDCVCCDATVACLSIEQECVVVDGVFVCQNNYLQPAPSPATSEIPASSRTDSPAASTIESQASSTTEFPAASQTDSSAAFTESHAQLSSSTATALRASTTTATVASPTSSKGLSHGLIGNSVASMGLQREDIVRVVFVTGLLLAFGDFF